MMPRYTLAELNRRPIDAITLATPTAVLESVENRVSMLLSDSVSDELHDAVLAIIADAHTELDRIEEERG
jgi:hypothetical protein